jgi:23S rRNA pseudouridine2605 synthase
MQAKPERLQKILAAAGIASRRKAEELIAAGKVSVNGHTVTEPGTKADPRTDEIRVNGQLLRGPERHVYLAMYKPKGYMTTVSDPEGRPTVMDLLKGVEQRIFPVGRLDYMSEGLLLLTNDGDLMAQLTRAGSHVPKSYMVKVSGKPSEEAIEKLRQGILLPPEPGLTGARGKKQPGVERRSFAVLTRPAEIHLAVDQENPWFEVTITEGRNRQLRRMFEQVGHHIEKIKRIRYGSLTLDLEPGQFRYLTPKEVGQLRKSLERPFKPRPAPSKTASKAAKAGYGKTKPARAKEVYAKAGQRPERGRRFEEGRGERTPRVEAVRFVRGRRGKPSAERAEGAPAFQGDKRRAPAKSARQAPGRPESAARGFQRPRGPEFGREGQAEERPRRTGSERVQAGKPRKWSAPSSGEAEKRKFSKGPGKPYGKKQGEQAQRSGGSERKGSGFQRSGGRSADRPSPSGRAGGRPRTPRRRP